MQRIPANSKASVRKSANQQSKVTYQAIHKDLQELVKEKIVKKKKNEYAINKKTIKKLKQKIKELEEKTK